MRGDREVPVFYSPEYVVAGYAFETTRKAQWVAESLRDAPMDGVALVEPEALSFDDVADVHDRAYVEAVRSGVPLDLATSQGFAWDDGLWRMALATNGGAVAAARAALAGSSVAGSLSSGLHHARREQGRGFCTFNGLVLAAKAALGHGAAHVLVLDLDAHCGGGTASLIASDERLWQGDVSVSSFDRYEATRRSRLAIVSHAEAYLPEIARVLAELADEAPPFDLCLYNAGMDPLEHCPVGGLRGIGRDTLAERERMVFDWCRTHAVPIAFVLAGGYLGPALDRDTLVGLHRLTLQAAVGS